MKRLKHDKTGHGNCPSLGSMGSCSRWNLVRKMFIKEYPWDHHGCWEGKEAEVERSRDSCQAAMLAQ